MKKITYPEKLIILAVTLLMLTVSGISEGSLSGFPLFFAAFAAVLAIVRIAECFCVIDRKQFVRLMRQIAECVNGCSGNNRSHIEKRNNIRRAA